MRENDKKDEYFPVSAKPRHGFHLRRAVLAGVILVFLSPAAHADAGIPMLPIAYPVVLLFLLPVIAIESIYLRAKLKTGWWGIVKGVSIVNAVTLILGYPLAWVLAFVVEYVFTGVALLFIKAGFERTIERLPLWASGVLAPAWLGPTEDIWPILVAFVVLLIPAFFLSGYVEARMMAKRIELSGGVVKRAVWQANVCSYVFLAVAGFTTLYFYFRRQ